MTERVEALDDQMMVTVVAGAASEIEDRLVKARRASDPAFDATFLRLQALWEAAELPYAKLNIPPAPSPEAIIALAENRAAREGGWRPYVRSWTLLAAASLAAVLGWGLFGSGQHGAQQAQPQALFTGPDETATVTLEDGTLIRVAPDSRLTFSASSRKVDLEGRAFFAVAHQNGEPFVVRLPNRVITVLGTRFDVEGRDDATRVAVLEGLVRVSGDGSNGEVVAAVAKDQVAYGPDSGELLVRNVDDVYESVEWMGSFLAFETTPLPEVADELLRRFDLHVSVADELLSRTVTGWFTNTRPDAMIASICTAVAAQCTMKGADVFMEERTAGSSTGLRGWGATGP